jgi:hypothetical protein
MTTREHQVKVILSRKVFDSGYGGWASPILPDGRMLSLPIPASNGLVSYEDLSAGDGVSYLEIMHQLRYGRKDRLVLSHEAWLPSRQGISAHLDPDLVASALERLPGWRGMFGQANAASSHLLNHQVGPGDLFLFFGRFRHAERVDGRLSPAHEQDMHAIWGYMYVGEILEGSRATHFPDWALRHPHTQECFLDSSAYKHNQLFVAAPTIPGTKVPGWGRFLWNERLQLTRPGSTSLCDWQLHPCFREVEDMSYHPGGESRYGWHDETFCAAKKGQEFVIPAGHNAVEEWAMELIRDIPAEH